MARSKNHYVNNKKLYTEMIKYLTEVRAARDRGETRTQIPKYIGECIFHIATNLATKPNFVGYSYKDEMISDGMENCFRYLHSFNPDRSNNPFAYFTTTIKNAFIRRIKEEKKQQYIKYKSYENSIVTNTLFDNVEDDGGLIYNTPSDKANDVIRDFEENIAKKKNKLNNGD